MVMDKVVRMAKERGVMVGAHPGYPDLLGFGRRKMVLSHDEVKNYVRYQIGALAAFTKSYGMKLQHVAPHGAMGNACQYDEDISTAICEAVCEYDKDLIVYYCAGAVLGDIAESKGLRTASEIFADRARKRNRKQKKLKKNRKQTQKKPEKRRYRKISFPTKTRTLVKRKKFSHQRK